ncbi:hypothetical protein MchiMG62_13530 [Methanoculleus chikugoensis]|uniref:Uncharacterized protein n=2 Tax=Methanoculleus chikugoensis TaxID=118126 RepID=A0ABM7H5W1_9EURY|nr:hypothetical protein MchiMG62_13530 [Methanoculleus chikugoensis]
MCGEVINVQRVPVYLDADDFQDAERVVEQLESYLHQTGKKDLTEQDIRQLRAQYARWVKNRV